MSVSSNGEQKGVFSLKKNDDGEEEETKMAGQKAGFTLMNLLKDCIRKKNVLEGTRLHAEIVRKGLLENNLYLATALITMYTKCGMLAKAQKILEELPFRNVVSWNALIAGYTNQGKVYSALNCFESMLNEGISPDVITFTCALKACGKTRDVDKGKKIHTEIVSRGLLVKDIVLSTAVVDMYAKCGLLGKAREVLLEFPVRDVVSWSALISGYVKQGKSHEALDCFGHMEREGFLPNAITFICILRACGNIRAIYKGQSVHDIIVNEGLLEKNIVLGSALVDMYVKCGRMEKARQVLKELPRRNEVSWNTLIAGYAERGQCHESLKCLEQMQREGISPTLITFICILKACGKIGAIDKGTWIHNEIMKSTSSFKTDTPLGNALVDMYVRCGSLDEAMNTIYRLPNRNVVTWNSLIAGCACDDNDAFALNIFKKMQQDDVKPDVFTFSTLLNICSRVGSIQHGEIVHEQMLRSGIKLDVVIETILVDMYAKCGYLRDAQKILESMPHRDVMSYNALISAYTQHGHCKAAIECFNGLRERGLKPNADTYANILAACNHSGALLEARYFLKSMRDEEGIVLGIEHINSIIDLLARLGLLNEAEKLLETMPGVAGIIGWRSLLASCKTYGNPMLGRQCYDEAVSIEAEIQYSGPKPT